MGPGPSLLRFAGSLWLAAVVLILLMVAMAAATVYEAGHGTPAAMAAFYQSHWFAALLVLLGINVASALVLRWPFSRRQIGFVLTHGSLLLVLLGALVTKHFGIDGQLAVEEGQTAKTFVVPQEALTVVNRATGTQATADLPARSLNLDDLNIRIEQTLPDSTLVRQVRNDNPQPRPAVEVSLSESGRDHPLWIFADAPPETLADVVRFRAITDAQELDRLLKSSPTSQPAATGVVRVEYQGTSYDIPLKQGLAKPVPLGTTNLTVRVLRYLPHAVVGPDRQLTNASAEPVNPAIEVELAGPGGTEHRRAFARFPDFAAMHRHEERFADLKLTFVRPTDADAAVPIDILRGPHGDLYVRLSPDTDRTPFRKVALGTPLDTPWPGQKFSILRQFDRARTEERIEPVDPVRPNRQPAARIAIETPKETAHLWLRKNSPRTIQVADQEYEFTYGDQHRPLGFDLTLERFHVGTYPGEHQPRSFESHVTVRSPAGPAEHRVIRMNAPLAFGGYSFYQSSYHQEDGTTVSILSVSWDPGKPIVFAGYIGLMAGMAIVLVTRRRRRG